MSNNSLYKDIVTDLLNLDFKKELINIYYYGNLKINVSLYRITLYEDNISSVRILKKISCYPKSEYNTERLISDGEYIELFELIKINKRKQKLNKLSNDN